MTIETVYETANYRYDHDTLYGTGWFVRKSDDHVSLMDTGVEAQDRKLEYSNYFTDDPDSIKAFHIGAMSAQYSPRWSRDNE